MMQCVACGKKMVDQRKAMCSDCDWDLFVRKLYRIPKGMSTEEYYEERQRKKQQ